MNFINDINSINYVVGIDTSRCDVSTPCVHAFSVHFYLRDKRAKRHTTIVVVIRHCDCRVKFSLPIHVVPTKWDKHNERFYLTDSESLEFNRQLSYIRCDIEKLCISLQDIEQVKKYVFEKFTMPTKRIDNFNIESILRKAFRLYYDEKQAKGDVKDSTRKNKVHQLNKLCELIKDMGFNDSRKFLSQKGYEQLKEAVIDHYGGYTSGGNEKCQLFAMLLNHVRAKQDFLKYGIEPIEYKKFSIQKGFKTNLLEDEIKALEEITLDNEQENNTRYLFLIETECGSRNCDLAQVVKLVQEVEVGRAKAYTETKEGGTAVVVNTEKLQFYISQLTDKHKKISCTYANNLLKRIARKANLCRAIETMDNRPLHDCISTHFGRHTFITNMLKNGALPNEVIKFTGHASTEIVNKTYAHLSKEDHEASVERIIAEIQTRGKQTQQAVTPQPQLKSLPNSIDEAKQVLNYLGAPPNDYIEITDLDELLRLVSCYESYIIQRFFVKGGVAIKRIEEIKQVFNENAPIIERQQHLRRLAGFWRDENTERNS